MRVKSGFQEKARDWRRQECERVLAEQAHSGPSFICTAHNSDDQNETMMLKLLRGVHLSNFQPVIKLYVRFAFTPFAVTLHIIIS